MKKADSKKFPDYVGRDALSNTLTLHEICRETILGY